MTVDEARKKIVESVNSAYEGDEAKNIAELLLERVTNLALTERIIKKSESLSSEQEKLLLESISRLQDHEPIQYIINECWFAGMKFYVDKNVLIPRPETEELADWVVSESKLTISNRQYANLKVLDIGTGSGCIAIAIKAKLPNVEMWACDISDEALNVARMNADALRTAIDFVSIDFLDTGRRKQLPHVDVIVSNPPYVPQRDKKQMKRNVADYEPSAALFVPDNDPMIFYDAIADFGKKKLNRSGAIYTEIHEHLGERIKNLFRAQGYSSVQLKKDLQGKDRMIRASINP